MSTNITGGCLCGGVRYALTAPPVWSHACHCSRCRKATGAAFAPNLFAPLEAFRYVEGEALVAQYKVPEAERFVHFFCTRCGSTLPFRNEARGLVGIPMGTLDDDPGMAPRAHIYVGSKAPWYETKDDVPMHVETLESPKI